MKLCHYAKSINEKYVGFWFFSNTGVSGMSEIGQTTLLILFQQKKVLLVMIEISH
jgi:hypothetical protein